MESGVLAQGQSRRYGGDDALLAQYGGESGGKGHHAGLGVAGLVDEPLGIGEADLLEVEVHLRAVQYSAEGGVGVVQVRTHTRVLTALSGI